MKNKELKKQILDISYRLKLSHIGSCLTAVDIIKEIYDIKKPDEKFVLSSGHAHLAHAVVMEAFGVIDSAEENIEKWGIHCDRRGGCDVSTGSLGHGLPIAVGIALGDRERNVYALVSDGECAEGSIWEALRIAKEYKLNNLKIYVNYNGYGAYGAVDSKDLNRRLYAFHHNIYDRYTSNELPFLKGLDAHYHVMTQDEYNQAWAMI